MAYVVRWRNEEENTRAISGDPMKRQTERTNNSYVVPYEHRSAIPDDNSTKELRDHPRSRIDPI